MERCNRDHGLSDRLRSCVLPTLGLAFLLAVAPPSQGEAWADAGEFWSANAVPSDEVLEARGAVIGEITVLTHDVFDPDHPGERFKLYRLTNRLHVTTRPEVIHRQLLVREGDLFSRRALEESERILRANPYLYDAEIRTVGYRGNRVDLEVRTRDVWTLRPGISLGRSGGVNSTDVKLQDHNLLGTGQSLTLKYTSDIDRDTVFLRYEDPHLFGRWLKLKLHYGDASDGGVRFFELGRPFYSVDTRRSAGVRFLDDDRVDSLFSLGELADFFSHRTTFFEVHAGRSAGLKDGRARRWTAGLTYEEHRFGPADAPPKNPRSDEEIPDIYPTRGRPGRPLGPLPPKTGPLDPSFPPDRTLAFPWIRFSSVGDRYEETHGLDQMGRTEDVELGYRYSARLGWASKALGSDREAAIFDAQVSAGFQPTDRHTLFLSGETSGRWGEAGAEDVRLSGRARFYWRDFGRHVFFVNVEADAVHALDPEDQLLLGGDSGLRGYPLRYQDGEQRLLVTLEQRIFTDLYPFRLFYVGGAVFVDVGRTWGEGVAPDLGTLSNAGFGLRLSSSRSGNGSVIHLDVAFPLGAADSIESVQWLISTKSSF
jgi:hypothetical protein